MSFKPTYLYVKTHLTTGLKYFGKTTKANPHNYTGSGEYWLKHLNVHGKHFSTDIIGYFGNKEECVRAATDFSIKHNIVESSDWANFKIENGIDGGSDIGHKKHNTKNMSKAASTKARKRIGEGTFHFSGEAGSTFAKERNATLVKEGRHNFQGTRGSEHSRNMNKKMLESGTHPFQGDAGRALTRKRIENGTFSGMKLGQVSVVDKQGNATKIAKEQFWAQSGPKEEWEYVGITSKIAQSRLLKK
jgi:hypothetical protein